jgi:glycosyltransferase involved in cell wall biosynthesis
MKIAFHIYQFTFRGSEVATFDYAFYNQTLLHNTSIIVVPKIQKLSPDKLALEKFNTHFPIFYYDDLNHLEEICKQEQINAMYIIKYGTNDNLILKNIPTWVHCVFTTEEPHGTVYAGVSESVSKKNKNNITYPFVNHIVWLPEINSDYRKQLNIPEHHTVIGRHGGTDTFNIPFVKEAIIEVLNQRDDIWFLFCVKPDMLNGFSHPRVLFLDSFVDLRIKRKFINTCDAMIHACTLGESFGLSILEFSYCNKPVITWNGGIWHTQHLTNLGDKAILYNNKTDVINILKSLSTIKSDRPELLKSLSTIKSDRPELLKSLSTIKSDRPELLKSINRSHQFNVNVTSNFTPTKIMEQFEKVFIKSNQFKK